MSLQRIANAEIVAIVEDIARSLVDNPDKVDVQLLDDAPAGFVIRLYVASQERGQVIGKRGRTAHSIRTIICAFGSHRGQRYTLDIVNPGEDYRVPDLAEAALGMKAP